METVVVPMTDVTKSDVASNGDEATFKFAIPESVKGQKGVTVTLNNLVSLDGYDHSHAVMAVYDTFVITYSDPANDEKLAGLNKEQVITVQTNYSEQYPELYLMYEIEDMNPENPDEAIVKTQSWMNRQTDGSYTAEIPLSIKFFQGHTYRMAVTAWETEMGKNYGQEPIGVGYVNWTGTSKPYVPSTFVLESIDPEPETVLPADFTEFTVKFDGLVKILNSDDDPDNKVEYGAMINLGMGMSQPFKAVTPVDPVEDSGETFRRNLEARPRRRIRGTSDSLHLHSVPGYRYGRSRSGRQQWRQRGLYVRIQLQRSRGIQGIHHHAGRKRAPCIRQGIQGKHRIRPCDQPRLQYR